jgi:hypothetical protein
MKKLIKDTPRQPTEAELRAIESEADENDAAEDAGATALASTPVDLAHMGLDQVAYVRQAVIDNVQVWSIHSAMGHHLGAAPTLAQAWGAIVQNDLQPLYVN